MDLQSWSIWGVRPGTDILGVRYVVANPVSAASYVYNHRQELQGKYICFSNVHTTVLANQDSSFAEVENTSAVTFPDGMPIARELRKRGFMGAQRVAGPDFMNDIFRMSMDGKIKHYFYGSKEETLEKLKARLEKRYPGICIAGMYSPPFRQMSEEEDHEAVGRINASGADFIWIGLGAPKQEKWMYSHMGKLNGVMLGVGAGFDFYADTIQRAPAWIQRIGMEWLYRLFQDPKRLFKRYFTTNIVFLWKVTLERLKTRSSQAH